MGKHPGSRGQKNREWDSSVADFGLCKDGTEQEGESIYAYIGQPNQDIREVTLKKNRHFLAYLW